jgi:hypothetical protein
MGAAGIAPPAQQPDQKPPDFKVSEDGNILERDGRKYVPFEALQEERRARQTLNQTLSTLEPVLPEFKEFLRLKDERERNVQPQQRQSVQDSSDEYSQEELEGLAYTRGYYQTDGVTPDTKRAKAELALINRIVERKADARMKPLAEQSAADRASANRQAAYTRTYEDGQPFARQEYLDAAFNALPAHFLADPNVSNATQIMAAGLEYLDLRRNGQLRGRGGRDPMLVERGGPRRPGEDSPLNALDLAAAKARGKTPEAWAKLQKQVSGGNLLEDI